MPITVTLPHSLTIHNSFCELVDGQIDQPSNIPPLPFRKLRFLPIPDT